MSIIDLVKTNVFRIEQNDPILTVDLSELDRKNAERRAAADAAEKAANPPDTSTEWRGELETLTRQLSNQLTIDEAKTYSDNQASLHKDAVRVVEGELKYLRELLAEPGISRCPPLREGRQQTRFCNCDTCLFTRKIEAVTITLQQVKHKQEISIRNCGEAVRQAREVEPLRKRFKELSERAKKIDSARRNIRGLNNNGPLQRERITQSDHTSRGGFHFTKD